MTTQVDWNWNMDEAPRGYPEGPNVDAIFGPRLLFIADAGAKRGVTQGRWLWNTRERRIGNWVDFRGEMPITVVPRAWALYPEVPQGLEAIGSFPEPAPEPAR